MGRLTVPLNIILLAVLLVFAGQVLARESPLPDRKPDGMADYPFRPDNELHFLGLDLQIEAGFDDGTIRGTAQYRFRTRNAHVEKVVWAAPGMTIRELLLNGEQVPYQIEDDSLVISFPGAPDPAREHTITVAYATEPGFGVHFRYNGTIFTSALPGSSAHWIPGPIHPWAAMPVIVRLEVPENMTGVASGAFERQTSTNKGRLFVFRTEVDVSLADLFFAIGDFEVEESFSGTKSLRIYREKGVSSRNNMQELLSFMTRRVREYERLLQSELPVPAFHAVLLSDNMWETRPYYAGAAIVHGGQDQARTVITRAITAQWFGIALRPEQWKESSHITLLQALAAEKLDEPDWQAQADPVGEAFVIPETVYQLRNMDHWQWARHFLSANTMPVLSDALDDSFRSLAAKRGVFTATHFSALMYEKTGKWMDVPVIRAPDPDPALRYKVIAGEVRGSDRITLEFLPLEDITEDSITVQVRWVRDGQIHETPVTFSGSGDNVDVTPGGFVNNLWVEAAGKKNIRFEMDKPFSHWLYQLRRDEYPERRREAALALRNYSSDPDLQLAVQDLLNREENPEVLAAMVELMAELTAGASGTERRFLDGLSSRHEQVRFESLKALRAYRGNTRVENEVFAIIQGSDDMAFVNEAIRTYRELIPEDQFRDFAIRFLREDRQDQLFTRTLIQELFSIPADESAVNAVREYLNPGYSFELRWLAYSQLRKHAADAGWQQDFVTEFSDDADPRIRFITLFSVPRMDYENRGPFLSSRMLVEYDIRILKLASEFASSN